MPISSEFPRDLPSDSPHDISPAEDPHQSDQPACVMVFNANDPSGAGGLAADVTAIASVGAHALPVVTGAYARDTAEIFNHFTLDEDAVSEQARAVLEDVPVQVFKIGFVGSPDNLGVVAGISADYPDAPLIAYMPSLAWWDEAQIDARYFRRAGASDHRIAQPLGVGRGRMGDDTVWDHARGIPRPTDDRFADPS